MTLPTPDKIIAANVARFREARGWTQNDLAKRLGVNKHLVLDYEGRRTDREQRPFRWSELIALCYVLEVTMFELVLPADSETLIDLTSTNIMQVAAIRVAWGPGPVGTANREDLGLGLFGASGDGLLEAESLSTLAKFADDATSVRREIVDKVWKSVVDGIRDLAEKYPGLTMTEAIDKEEEE
jgi:transcriptional regulator with XRE-family HTH domain